MSNVGSRRIYSLQLVPIENSRLPAPFAQTQRAAGINQFNYLTYVNWCPKQWLNQRKEPHRMVNESNTSIQTRGCVSRSAMRPHGIDHSV